MNNSNKDYSDIINLPHHVSKKHPQMSQWDRAAQFAPFAALTGYDAMIEEAGADNALKEDSVVLSQDGIYLP